MRTRLALDHALALVVARRDEFVLAHPQHFAQGRHQSDVGVGYPPESLREVPLESSRQALELLFRLEGEFGLVPDEIDGELVLKIDKKAEKSQKLAQAVKTWKHMIDSEKAGEISSEELSEWKLSLH